MSEAFDKWWSTQPDVLTPIRTGHGARALALAGWNACAEAAAKIIAGQLAESFSHAATFRLEQCEMQIRTLATEQK